MSRTYSAPSPSFFAARVIGQTRRVSAGVVDVIVKPAIRLAPTTSDQALSVDLKSAGYHKQPRKVSMGASCVAVRRGNKFWGNPHATRGAGVLV